MAKNYVKLDWVDTDILYAKYMVDVLNLEDARDALAMRLNFVDNKSHKMLVDISGIGRVTKEARNFLGSEEGYTNITATAIIVNTPVMATMANFFMRFSSQPVPVKMVKSYDDGLAWLQGVKI